LIYSHADLTIEGKGIVWNKLKIEELLEKKLKKEFGKARGEEIYGDYTAARKQLVEDILDEIQIVEPNLTKHGATHVHDVLKKISMLLGNKADKLQAVDLYCLCVSALFHDVGNLLGREEHNKKISDIYAFVRKGDQKYRDEQFIVTKVCEAHCGCSEDGSTDTLKDVPISYHLHENEVKPQMIATILRFADELAEGPQRTSAYMQSRHKYPSDSKIYHEYASITKIYADRGNGRIVVTYDLEIKSKDGKLTAESFPALEEMLNYIYKRIIKLDQERKYAKHYCLLLSPFKETSVQLNFWLDKNLLSIGVGTMILSDLVLPGDDEKDIPQRNKEYEINDIFKKIQEAHKKLQQASNEGDQS
jgi:hypothetical protein